MKAGASLALVLAAATAHADAGADSHLFAGGRHFREGRFDAALLEFRVAGRLGRAGPALWYSGAALVKLGRLDDAVEAFASAEVVDPGGGDAMLAYYRAVALYECHLLVSADRALTTAGKEAGPRIAGEIAALRRKIGTLLVREPEPAEIDAYLRRAEEAAAAARPALAAAFLWEAAGLGERREDRYRSVEARASLARLALPARAGPGR